MTRKISRHYVGGISQERMGYAHPYRSRPSICRKDYQKNFPGPLSIVIRALPSAQAILSSSLGVLPPSSNSICSQCPYTAQASLVPQGGGAAPRHHPVTALPPACLFRPSTDLDELCATVVASEEPHKGLRCLLQAPGPQQCQSVNAGHRYKTWPVHSPPRSGEPLSLRHGLTSAPVWFRTTAN
jgi:hypothetical protein